jgi:copper oxidase (laccase) domain-containing protein
VVNLSPRSGSRQIPVWRVPQWADGPGLVHGFCSRYGGVSGGPFAELNLSLNVGDDVDVVRENWRRVCAALGGSFRRVRMRQVHGDRVVTVCGDAIDAGDADAVVTATPGVLLHVLTADCVPILLVAPGDGVVGAVHAGWRGTVAGIVPRVLGHIRQVVADAIEERFGALPKDVLRLGGSASKARVDLRAVNATLLARGGVAVENVTTIGPCTCCNSNTFFSHRSAAGKTGRQASLIGWKN